MHTVCSEIDGRQASSEMGASRKFMKMNSKRKKVSIKKSKNHS